ncbi:NAD(P)-binding protein [Sistotremastrum niveocremeum HHB9708]|uniref:NAD(P)-binding protein n=1 Tax=Sistotremastrum niveocremeum HHB9708 TaxID=1314777 RepID=A0A164XKR4_9AGAM|nr:NAD(P)-binding protein [Sistotremastrum niveocremeum HHB9708]
MTSIAVAKCVLIIGATSGIGRALAQAIHDLPSQPTVIVSGRRKERLDEMVASATQAGSSRLESVTIDLSSGTDKLKEFVKEVTTLHPELDAVIFSSGIQNQADFTHPEKVELNDLFSEFTTNYLSIMSLITFILPHFIQHNEQGRPTFIIPITSGLAILPFPRVPNYCSTKAALHSLSLSLRQQFIGTKINVMEIMPPLVESELHDKQGTTSEMSKRWMPLKEFTRETMEALLRGDLEIPVGSANDDYTKFDKGKVNAIEQRYNDKK